MEFLQTFPEMLSYKRKFHMGFIIGKTRQQVRLKIAGEIKKLDINLPKVLYFAGN